MKPALAGFIGGVVVAVAAGGATAALQPYPSPTAAKAAISAQVDLGIGIMERIADCSTLGRQCLRESMAAARWDARKDGMIGRFFLTQHRPKCLDRAWERMNSVNGSALVVVFDPAQRERLALRDAARLERAQSVLDACDT